MPYEPGPWVTCTVDEAVAVAIEHVNPARLEATYKLKPDALCERELKKLVTWMGNFARLDPAVRFGVFELRERDARLDKLEEPATVHQAATIVDIFDPEHFMRVAVQNKTRRRLDWLNKIEERVSKEIEILEAITRSQSTSLDQEPIHTPGKSRRGRPDLGSLWTFCQLAGHYLGLVGSEHLEVVHRLARSLHLTDHGLGQFKTWYRNRSQKQDGSNWLERMGVSAEDDVVVPTMKITFPALPTFDKSDNE
jgi:hypothetical protein